MMFCSCLTQRSINYKATLADGMRVALLIHDSLHDIMFLASLQRIVRCARSKEEETRSDDSRLVLHVLLPRYLLMLFMKFRVLCLEHHSQQNSKALHCLAGFRHDVVSLFLSRDHCTLSVVLTHRKYTTSGSLSVARLCFLFFFGGVGAAVSIDCVTRGSKARQHRLGNSEELFSDRR